jgi:Tol biopolymer transport system component
MMELAPGRDLSHYRLLERIGEGGMGVVWKASDTTLGRDVAIKVLPAAFASDPERMARFEREARLLASLNHPHIAAIYGVGQVDGLRFLAMELVEGEDLSQRLARGPMSVLETLEMGRELAEALEAAHEKGIIHRDLKPANIKLTAQGQVKVLDFGLAKALDAEAPAGSSNVSMSPTLTSPMTAANVILGTAAYMSPEQARGKLVDRRADIWSFGCVLYECLTAQRPFPGETVSDTLAKILERDPDWSALPANTPTRLRELLRRCFEKDARKRLRDIGDARIELDELLAAGVTSSGSLAAGAVPAGSMAGSAPSPLAWIVAGIALLLAAAAAFLPVPWRASTPKIATRASILAPSGQALSSIPVNSAISPDGSAIAYVASDTAGVPQLMLRPVHSLESRTVPGASLTNMDAVTPFWSPDSKTIGYFSDGKLFTIPASGGSARFLCSTDNARGGTWSRNDVILFAPTSHGPLSRVSANGGEVVAETVLDSARQENAQRFPQFLPDGQHYTYVSLPGTEGKIDTYVGKLGSREHHLLVRAGSGAHYAAPGYMVFARDQAIVAQKVDAGFTHLEGEPVVIGETPNDQTLLGSLCSSASSNGLLVYPTDTPTSTKLQYMGADGSLQQPLPIPAGRYSDMRISPDGSHVALLRSDSPTSSDLWIADLRTGDFSRLTTDGARKASPRWSGDGSRIAYAVQRGASYDFYVRAISGAGGEQPFYKSASGYKNMSDISADDSLILFDDLGVKTQRDLQYVRTHGDQTPVTFLATPFNEVNGSLSPDKHWIVYRGDDSGPILLYAQSFPVPGDKVRITREGTGPFGAGRFDATQTRILAEVPGGVRIVPIHTGATLTVDGPGTLVSFPKSTVLWEALPDFHRFIVALPVSETTPTSLTLVTNWPALLKR